MSDRDVYEDALDIIGQHNRWKEPTVIMELLASAYLNAIRERRDVVDRDLAELDRVRAEAQEWKTRAEQAERERDEAHNGAGRESQRCEIAEARVAELEKLVRADGVRFALAAASDDPDVEALAAALAGAMEKALEPEGWVLLNPGRTAQALAVAKDSLYARSEGTAAAREARGLIKFLEGGGETGEGA